MRLFAFEDAAQPGLEVGRKLLGLAGRLQHRPCRERLKNEDPRGGLDRSENAVSMPNGLSSEAPK